MIIIQLNVEIIKVFDDLLIFWFPKYKIESKTVDYSQSPSTNWARILPIGR